MQTRTSLILAAAGLAAALGVAAAVVLANQPADEGRSTPAVPPVLAVHDGGTPAPAPDLESSAAAERGSTGSLIVAGPPAFASDGAELVTVQIVREDSRAPVPNAQVWHWPSADIGSDDLALWLPRGVLEDHLGEATALRADSQGRLQVPRGATGFSLMAASGELWGCATFSSESATAAVLTLTRDVDVRVRVVDGKGAPVAGAPVVLQQRRGPASFDLLNARTEAPDGIARLRHAGHFLRAARGESFVVALQGLLDPPLERPIDPAGSPDEVVSLVLEPTGSCEVVVLAPGGQPLTGPLEATLRFAGTPSGGRQAQPDDAALLRSRSGVDVVFEHVELGRQLTVSVRREGSDAALEVAGPGPRRPGERVVLQARVRGEVAILRGRLVDAQGAALGGLAVHARIEFADGGAAGAGDWSLRTAPDGSFSVDCAPWPDDERMLAVGRLSELGAEVAVARRPLPSGLGSVMLDLGDFMLMQPPLAAAGVVVDDAGRPVADASVTASPVDPVGLDDGRTPDRALSLVPSRSDSYGRFEIFGDVGAAGTALVARKDSRAGGPVVARAGERGVRLVLGATGGLTGSVLLDPSLRDALVLVQVTRSDAASGPVDEPGRKPGRVDGDGRFSVRDLPPGSYRLGVVYAATGCELGGVEGLVVRAGEATRDARLEPLDLRAAGRLIELELVDEAGAPVPGGRGFSRASGGSGGAWSFASPVDGRLQLLWTGQPLDVAVSAAGFVRTQLEQVSASQRVVLRRAATLSLYLARGLQPPAPPLQLGVELTPLQAEGFGGFVDSVRCAFDESGMLTCRTEFTGELRVELVVLQPGASASAYLKEEAPRIITVADHRFEQPFEIRFDPARLAQAVEEALAER